MVQVRTNSLSLAVLLCFYVIFAFSINPLMDNFLGMSIEVTDQNNEGVFSSLSRNFEQTIEEINSADEKSSSSSDSSSNSADEKSSSSSSSSSSSDSSSNSADEKSTASKAPIAASESSNLASNNSTKVNDFVKKNQTDPNK
ncbi:hypothetical protein NMY3_02405 [Candidatus Nitrosocosmicus oleophilus]|uniref:Uncharacterized protein n=1 Tax=Candidatus Nitrosocosmicus oleophilus TaxID=1353260 RepID=A0A654M232_9ARCH|nr:hypothetical protein [Candidatus Nitrosocosmicus oleophilus]ALI36601.1 hypothetical protein NMY3_02405 [Candidatus Nitrosocosmicus oleophilus]